MVLYSKDIAKLRRIIGLAEALIDEVPKPQRGRPPLSTGFKKPLKRVRRTGKELAEFRKMLSAERKKGLSASELARKYGISTTYVYLLP